MMTATFKDEKAKRQMSMHPQKFALWLFLVTVIMVFASLTSYYIVKKSDGAWFFFDLPNYFYVNTAIIITSSITLHWAFISAKKDNFPVLRLAILITTILGIAFMIGQYFAGKVLYEQGLYLGKHTSADILYLLAGLHLAHVVGGVIFLIVVLFFSFNFKIHSKNMTTMEMCVTYWHFLGGLWTYLFVFLLVNR